MYLVPADWRCNLGKAGLSEGTMKAAFWRFAHRHYQLKKPMLLTDMAMFMWFAFFALVYGEAVLNGWVPGIAEVAVAILLLGAPLTLGILHRRIRIEAAKGPDALYRKRFETNR
jgi:ACR3 family arsenite efflux pump ArsB